MLTFAQNSQLKLDLNDESDRACVVTAAAWIDKLLVLAHSRLEPRTAFPKKLAHRIDFAHRRGWLDDDSQADLHTIRTLRNELAHSIDVISLQYEHMEQLLNNLRLPRRVYDDWGSMRVSATADSGLIFYTGKTPSEAVDETLRIGAILFRMGLAFIFAAMLDSLKFSVQHEEKGEFVLFELPDHLRAP